MSQSKWTAVFVLAALALAAAPTSAKDRYAEKPDKVVFLRQLPKDGGAPSAEHVNRMVVLSAVQEDDPYYDVVRLLLRSGATDVIAFDPQKPERAFKALRAILPGLVALVMRPEQLDVNVHFDLLERAAALDADPFVDFAFGYFTGATAEEAIAFAKATRAAQETPPAKSVLEFGPSTTPFPMTKLRPHKWAAEFKRRKYFHPFDAKDVVANLARAKDCGVLRAGGHGMPAGVDHGLSGATLRASGLDLFPALYFSGPCYCGVPGRWFDLSLGSARERHVPPEDSFLLALLKSRVSAVFAGLDPDRGETNHHALEHLLSTGDSLGMVAKSTYDECVVAYRRAELSLPQYEPGRGRPHRDIHDRMIAGGACRALFGDPRARPFEKAGDGPFPVVATDTKKGLEVVWRAGPRLGRYWGRLDVYRAKGGWTHRIRFQFELPLEKASKLRKFRVLSVRKDGKDLEYEWPTAALEVWGGKLRVHGMLIFPRAEPQALSRGKAFEARFLFRR